MLFFNSDDCENDTMNMASYSTDRAIAASRQNCKSTTSRGPLSDASTNEEMYPSSTESLTDVSLSTVSVGDGESSVSSLGEPKELDSLEGDSGSLALADAKSESMLRSLRFTYLLVTLVIMLADGLQGTHLYVLYESYGFSVASLYCLGFATGGLLSPVTGPLVDQMGRKRAALLYCGLEVLINLMEQFPFYYGLVISRMIGGFTTNLLSTVFETWLDTEYRRRGLAREKYELVMRDSVIVSNLAAIFSGYLAHVLAERYGAVGPFRGAVTCTTIAFIVVLCVWTENYGNTVKNSAEDEDDEDEDEEIKQPESACTQGMSDFLSEAISAFWGNSHMLKVGVSQGLSAGSLQIFVFLWVPALRQYADSAPSGSWGLDKDGQPAYGLIFGAYMTAGVLGGLIAPPLRRWVTAMVTPQNSDGAPVATIEIEGEGIVPVRPMAVELLAATCYFISAMLLFVPSMELEGSPNAFSSSLTAFLVYELMIGIFLPCEGVIRSLYFPTNARASVMTLPRIIVNFAVALGVVSTNYISLKTAFSAVGCLMAISGILQLSLVSQREWSSLFIRASDFSDLCVTAPAKRLSFSVREVMSSSSLRRLSSLSADLDDSEREITRKLKEE